MSNFKFYLNKYKEFGIVEAVFHPIAVVSGLPNVQPKEVVIFDNNIRGQVLRLSRSTAEILLYSHHPVRVGQQLTRTGEPLKIPVGSYILGQVVDPLGKLLLPIEQAATSFTTELEPGYWDKYVIDKAEDQRLIDAPQIKKLLDRVEIRRQLVTGVTLVDLLLPMGKGQRELVVGDRKTGKTSFVLSAMKAQIEMGGVVVYSAIGKKSIEIEMLREFSVRHKMLQSMVIVATTAHDSASLIYSAPFSAMTIAEYLRDNGNDVLVVLDDLSTHAKFYREISLLAHQFPGRDSYPGDIFFTHARLLERAGNYKHQEKGEAAITCLPMAETQENDLSDYIVSNLIGITDGHILFDKNEYIKGRRPAVNVSLSVTRVGKQTQTPLNQEINRKVLAFLGQYERSQVYSHFGSELNQTVHQVLDKGNLLYTLFSQSPEEIVPRSIQIISVALIWLDLLSPSQLGVFIGFRKCLVQMYAGDKVFRETIDKAINVDKFEDLLVNVKAISPHIFAQCQVSLN